MSSVFVTITNIIYFIEIKMDDQESVDFDNLTIEQTMILPEIANEVPKEDYKYYYVDPEIRPPQIAHRFEPDDEIMFFRAKNSKERLVFPINEQYDSDEEEEIDKFDQY